MQNFVLTPADLLTVAGSAAITAIVVQLFVKPILINLIADGRVGENWYAVLLNLFTLVVASLFVTLGVFALGELPRATLVQGVITAVLATSLAVGGYEFSKNASRLAKK